MGGGKPVGQPGQFQPVFDDLGNRIRRQAAVQHPVGLGDGAEQLTVRDLRHIDSMHQSLRRTAFEYQPGRLALLGGLGFQQRGPDHA